MPRESVSVAAVPPSPSPSLPPAAGAGSQETAEDGAASALAAEGRLTAALRRECASLREQLRRSQREVAAAEAARQAECACLTAELDAANAAKSDALRQMQRQATTILSLTERASEAERLGLVRGGALLSHAEMAMQDCAALVELLDRIDEKERAAGVDGATALSEEAGDTAAAGGPACSVDASMAQTPPPKGAATSAAATMALPARAASAPPTHPLPFGFALPPACSPAPKDGSDITAAPAAAVAGAAAAKSISRPCTPLHSLGLIDPPLPPSMASASPPMAAAGTPPRGGNGSQSASPPLLAPSAAAAAAEAAAAAAASAATAPLSPALPPPPMPAPTAGSPGGSISSAGGGRLSMGSNSSVVSSLRSDALRSPIFAIPTPPSTVTAPIASPAASVASDAPICDVTHGEPPLPSVSQRFSVEGMPRIVAGASEVAAVPATAACWTPEDGLALFTSPSSKSLAAATVVATEPASTTPVPPLPAVAPSSAASAAPSTSSSSRPSSRIPVRRGTTAAAAALPSSSSPVATPAAAPPLAAQDVGPPPSPARALALLKSRMLMVPPYDARPAVGASGGARGGARGIGGNDPGAGRGAAAASCGGVATGGGKSSRFKALMAEEGSRMDEQRARGCAADGIDAADGGFAPDGEADDEQNELRLELRRLRAEAREKEGRPRTAA